MYYPPRRKARRNRLTRLVWIAAGYLVLAAPGAALAAEAQVAAQRSAALFFTVLVVVLATVAVAIFFAAPLNKRSNARLPRTAPALPKIDSRSPNWKPRQALPGAAPAPRATPWSTNLPSPEPVWRPRPSVSNGMAR